MANEKIVNRENLKVFRQAYDTRLENGTLVPEKSQTAKNLLPVSSASGSTQTAPFINQGTATNNNDSQAVVDTGTLGQHLEKQGNTICVNQDTRAINSTNWNAQSGSVTFSNGIATFTASAQNGYIYDGQQNYCINGHKYLVMVDIKLTTATTDVEVSVLGGYRISTIATTEWQTLRRVIAVDSSYSSIYSIQDRRASDWDAIQVKNAYIIDLTQWFGSNDNIPSDLLAHPENFFHYYNGSLAYNTGTLVNSNGRYIVNGGQNVWDEEWELGMISTSTGENVSDSSCLRDKNYIQIIPNADYICRVPSSIGVWNVNWFWYDKDKNFIEFVSNSNATKKAPANARYLRFYLDAGYGNTYNHDITISLYYAGEDYSQYIPYEEPKVYDTGDEILRKAGSVKDIKKPDGTITRNIGSVDLGSLSWEYNSEYGVWRAEVNNVKVNANIISDKYIGTFDNPNNQTNGTIGSGYSWWGGNPALFVKNSDQNTQPSGMCNYELTTPTTEQGTPFSENMDINDMGNMAWYSAYTDSNTNTLVSVPQGCKIFYPAWYVGFIDSLFNELSGSAYKVLSTNTSQSDLDDYLNGKGYYKQEDLSSGITDVAGLTYTTKKCIRIGNMCVLSIRASNETGNSIASNTKLFSLPSHAFNSSAGTWINGISDSQAFAFSIEYNGDVYNKSGAIDNGAILFINACYYVN